MLEKNRPYEHPRDGRATKRYKEMDALRIATYQQCVRKAEWLMVHWTGKGARVVPAGFKWDTLMYWYLRGEFKHSNRDRCKAHSGRLKRQLFDALTAVVEFSKADSEEHWPNSRVPLTELAEAAQSMLERDEMKRMATAICHAEEQVLLTGDPKYRRVYDIGEPLPNYNSRDLLINTLYRPRIYWWGDDPPTVEDLTILSILAGHWPEMKSGEDGRTIGDAMATEKQRVVESFRHATDPELAWVRENRGRPR